MRVTSEILALETQCRQGLPAIMLSQTRMKPSIALSKRVLRFEGLRKHYGRQTLLARSYKSLGITGVTLEAVTFWRYE